MASQWEHIKKVPNTNFIVDGFKFQTPKCRHYWLTHSHSDHTIGMHRLPILAFPTCIHQHGCRREGPARSQLFCFAGLYPTFNSGTIYCSHITANFCIKDLRIPPSCIRPLPLDTPVIVDGINVTLIDANHCPGAVLLLFRVPAPPGSEHSTQVLPGMRAHALPNMCNHASMVFLWQCKSSVHWAGPLPTCKQTAVLSCPAYAHRRACGRNVIGLPL